MAGRGEALNRSGRRYKPSVLRSYETSLRLHVFPIIGSTRLERLSRHDVQDLVDRIALDRHPSTVRNAIMPLRAVYRYALIRSVVSTNPTDGLAMPALEGGRDRVATPQEAEDLLSTLSSSDQAVWATAIYAGLRLGELQALDWKNVRLDQGIIQVECSWDKKVGLVEPKSRAGRRVVPVPAVLEGYLTAHRESLGEHTGLVFGRSATKPFADNSVRSRSVRVWEAAGLAPLGFHEARHTYASFMIAASVNVKALSTYMGHSSISTTLDRYGHLFPGNESEAAALLDAYLSGE
jgi:integrase